ncbi:hypothetical protein DVS28_b0264 (plasmid) [Euzebya pacifica]|uniref:Uncharacterized protein n=1 Tax=Euzebya pacifica TaxID=1608957 RepID=A0A346Y6D7_9ACTN|nr:hypothetical protein [Euzebya pacifica]AXV10034.1 hypothetical protein DVS28_b0264 [Euzebya pacifica]
MHPINVDHLASHHGIQYFREFVRGLPVTAGGPSRAFLHIRAERTDGEVTTLVRRSWRLPVGNPDQLDWTLAVQAATAGVNGDRIVWVAAHVDDPSEGGLADVRVSSHLTATADGMTGRRMPYRVLRVTDDGPVLVWSDTGVIVPRRRLRAAEHVLGNFIGEPTP